MKLLQTNKAELIVNLRKKLNAHNPNQNMQHKPTRMATGWHALDKATGGGLFRGALNEIQVEDPACGVLEALLPTLNHVSQSPGTPRKFWAWVHPHRLPYPPALSQMGFDLDRWLVVQPHNLHEQLWALETILRSGLCQGLVTFMEPEQKQRSMDPAWRRLQLAASEGQSTALLLGSKHTSPASSPAALRILARPEPGSGRRRRLHIEILKCRGLAFADPVLLEWSHDALDEPALSRSQLRKSDTRPSRQQNSAFCALRA